MTDLPQSLLQFVRLHSESRPEGPSIVEVLTVFRYHSEATLRRALAAHVAAGQLVEQGNRWQCRISPTQLQLGLCEAEAVGTAVL